MRVIMTGTAGAKRRRLQAIVPRVEAVADLEGVLGEGRESFLPGFGRVDVGAVGEVMAVVESHGYSRRPEAGSWGSD